MRDGNGDEGAWLLKNAYISTSQGRRRAPKVHGERGMAREKEREDVKSPGICGIGVVFRQDETIGIHRIFVERTVPGGPADRSGRVRKGDLLVTIDGKDVYGQDLEHITKSIVGPDGSAVCLGFYNFDRSYIEVTINRGIPVDKDIKPWFEPSVSSMVQNPMKKGAHSVSFPDEVLKFHVHPTRGKPESSLPENPTFWESLPVTEVFAPDVKAPRNSLTSEEIYSAALSIPPIYQDTPQVPAPTRSSSLAEEQLPVTTLPPERIWPRTTSKANNSSATSETRNADPGNPLSDQLAGNATKEQDFIAAPVYSISKPGYVFKNGTKGVGYYKDRESDSGNSGQSFSNTSMLYSVPFTSPFDQQAYGVPIILRPDVIFVLQDNILDVLRGPG